MGKRAANPTRTIIGLSAAFLLGVALVPGLPSQLAQALEVSATATTAGRSLRECVLAAKDEAAYVAVSKVAREALALRTAGQEGILRRIAKDTGVVTRNNPQSARDLGDSCEVTTLVAVRELNLAQQFRALGGSGVPEQCVPPLGVVAKVRYEARDGGPSPFNLRDATTALEEAFAGYGFEMSSLNLPLSRFLSGQVGGETAVTSLDSIETGGVVQAEDEARAIAGILRDLRLYLGSGAHPHQPGLVMIPVIATLKEMPKDSFGDAVVEVSVSGEAYAIGTAGARGRPTALDPVVGGAFKTSDLMVERTYGVAARRALRAASAGIAGDISIQLTRHFNQRLADVREQRIIVRGMPDPEYTLKRLTDMLAASGSCDVRIKDQAEDMAELSVLAAAAPMERAMREITTTLSAELASEMSMVSRDGQFFLIFSDFN